jgi:hypothetical protein
MCGGGGNQASQQAERNEAERQAQIARSVNAVNQAYNNPERAAQIAQYRDATQTLLQQDLDREKDSADRNARFAMARLGLSGGSADVDTNRSLAETYQRGVLDVVRQAQGAAAQLQGQDQQSRQNLIALAQSGVDATTSAQQAAESLRVNLANARGQVLPNAANQAFGSFAELYRNSQDQRGRADARRTGAGAGLYDDGFGAFGRGGGYWNFGG